MVDVDAALRALAADLGVADSYVDGLERQVAVGNDTLLAVLAGLGVSIDRADEADEALRGHRAIRAALRLEPVIVAWGGVLRRNDLAPWSQRDDLRVSVQLGDVVGNGADDVPLTAEGSQQWVIRGIPAGYHRLIVEGREATETSTLISTPTTAWSPRSVERDWGVTFSLPSLHTKRSRSVGDLSDLGAVGDWLADRGGRRLVVLPLLAMFTDHPIDPSPYSPASRLYWNELFLDLGHRHQRVERGETINYQAAAEEVRKALADQQLTAEPDDQLARYARFRAVQARLGRNWKDWPEPYRSGRLDGADFDPGEETYHLVGQQGMRVQLTDLVARLDVSGVQLGLDLAIGVHPDGFDTWDRQDLFAHGQMVGAPPDLMFPSGQNWGFPPIVPEASRLDGHRYVAAAIRQQTSIAGMVRLDHVMGFHRLFWIPPGFPMDAGTYVHQPTEELFAVLVLESHRTKCQLLGENLGTVPSEIGDALERHRIWGMYLAEFAARPNRPPHPPTATEVAMIDTHDTATLAGWMTGGDIDERVRVGLLPLTDAQAEHLDRAASVDRMLATLGVEDPEPAALLRALLAWLGSGDSPVVLVSLEDLWQESEPFNVPGTGPEVRANWSRSMALDLDEVTGQSAINELLKVLDLSRVRS